MTDPWCWYIYANIKGVFLDGIHGEPYIYIYSSTMDPSWDMEIPNNPLVTIVNHSPHNDGLFGVLGPCFTFAQRFFPDTLSDRCQEFRSWMQEQQVLSASEADHIFKMTLARACGWNPVTFLWLS